MAFLGAHLQEEQPTIGSFPEVDEAVQREFHALRDFLARLDDEPDQEQEQNQNHNHNGAGTPVEPGPLDMPPDQNLHWWVLLKGVNRLPTVAALRERLAAMPGCIAAQVVDLAPEHIRLGLTTSGQVNRRQIEFAILACRDVAEAEIVLRPSLPSPSAAG